MMGLPLPNIEAVMALIQGYGLWILAPFAIIEGPIATVLAAYLAHQGYMNLAAVYGVCVAGDLMGDALFYLLGRYGAGRLPVALLQRLGMTSARKLSMTQHFTAKGGRILIFAKITHSAGMPILIASGMAKMNFTLYIWYNLLGTLPKTAFLAMIGYYFGAAYGLIDTYIYRISLGVLVLLILGAAYYIWRRRI
jgi:membrane protein DedA with SNARE-associated domain